MGRYLLLIVAAISLGGIVYGASAWETNERGAQRQASSEQQALARGAAQSGFDAALHAIARDLSTRPNIAEQSVDAGESSSGRFVVRTTESASGGVRLRAEGVYGPARHLIEAEVLELFPLGSAVVVHAEEVKLKVEGVGSISGVDHRTPESGPFAGPAGMRRGIGFTSPETQAATAEDWDDTPSRLHGAPGVGIVDVPDAIVHIVEAALAGPGVIEAAEYELKAATIGTPDMPVVLHVTEKAKLEQGAVGYGLLIVDGDLVIQDASRWEGLVVVRATARDKRKVEIKADSQVLGGLVLLGEEFREESGGSDGFPDGHMDLDLFQGAGAPLDRIYHQHEWDDRYDLTYVDFFNGPDIGDAFTTFLSGYGPTASLRVEFVNTMNAAGDFTLGSLAAPIVGRIEDGFDQTLSVSSLQSLRLDFTALCTLRGTTPGRVKDDAVERDRAMTVRFWDGATLVYAVSAYEHAKTLRDGTPTCGSGGSTVVDSGLYGEFDLKVDGGAVLYSEESLGRIGRTVAEVRRRSRPFPWFIRSVPLW